MLDHLIGNASVKESIRRFVSAQRIPNSLLFAGPEGVGKKQFALELARAIVCPSRRENEACGECISCRRINKFELPSQSADAKEYDAVFFSEHPDVGIVVPANRTLRVGSIRALEAEANFRPYEATARVFIIDEAHKMNDTAANALLKTLEEPPSTSHIFVVTSKPNSLLPTIRSRLQALRFAPVEASEIEHLLLTTHKYSQEDARLIASSANGSVAAAVSAKIEEFRSKREEALEVLTSAVLERNIAALLGRTEKIGSRSTPEYEAFLDVLQILIHDVWRASLGTSNDPASDEVRKLAERSDPADLLSWLEEIESVRAALAVNINKKIATDALFLKMAAK